MSYIKPQITPPSPLIFAILNGGSKLRVNSSDLGSPRGKPAENTSHLTWRVGGLSRYEKLVLLMLLRTSGDGYSL
jgi:hypothetical protein